MSDSHELPGGGDLITGEAVALDLPAATVAVRVASGLVDVLVQGVLLAIGLAVALTAASEFDEALVPVAGIVSLVTALVSLSTAMETFTHGRTLGKVALGLRTVRDDAGPIGFRHAFIRRTGRRRGDLGAHRGACPGLRPGAPARQAAGRPGAGTYVVRERFPFPVVHPAVMPPHLAAWASGADIAPLPDGLVLAVRQFLSRATTLNPMSRATLCTQLVTRCSPTWPLLHPRVTTRRPVLAAVLAERRRRDEARLARTEQLLLRLRALR